MGLLKNNKLISMKSFTNYFLALLLICLIAAVKPDATSDVENAVKDALQILRTKSVPEELQNEYAYNQVNSANGDRILEGACNKEKIVQECMLTVKLMNSNHDGLVTIGEYVVYRKRPHAKKWNAWLTKHGHKLSAAGRKAYWKRRHAFMVKHRKMFLAKWRHIVGKAKAAAY